MLRKISELRGYAIQAVDGMVGKASDFYFDDEHWTIRYLVIDTGTWLADRKVLISPTAVGPPTWAGDMLPLSLSKAEVQNSPDIDTRKPVSRQQEAVYFGTGAHPRYRGGDGLWGMGAYPGLLTTEQRFDAVMRDGRQYAGRRTSDDIHLRSCGSVTGHRIHATDGDLGHVEDFLIDERTWAIHYLIVATGNWWGSRQVLIPPTWVERVNWSDATVSVGLTRQAVMAAPPYDSTLHGDRAASF